MVLTLANSLITFIQDKATCLNGTSFIILNCQLLVQCDCPKPTIISTKKHKPRVCMRTAPPAGPPSSYIPSWLRNTSLLIQHPWVKMLEHFGSGPLCLKKGPSLKHHTPWVFPPLFWFDIRFPASAAFCLCLSNGWIVSFHRLRCSVRLIKLSSVSEECSSPFRTESDCVSWINYTSQASKERAICLFTFQWRMRPFWADMLI